MTENVFPIKFNKEELQEFIEDSLAEAGITVKEFKIVVESENDFEVVCECTGGGYDDSDF